jgi:tetratricopeptide (TPR) repeat protein
MKAERRHELKQNTLARGIENLPEASRQHGSRVLVGVLVALLVVFLIRQRITSSREAATRAAWSLDSARAAIGQIDEAIDFGGAQNPAGMAKLRQDVYQRSTDALQTVLDATDDPRLLAEARLARGDLNWKLANFPDVPGAQTQPALQFARSREDLLKTAADSYLNVVEDPAAPPESMRTARLGLAAVYENRKEWDKARAEYQKIVNDNAVPKAFKDLAVERLNNLDQVQRPPLLASPSTAESTLPTISSMLRAPPASNPATITAPISATPPATATAPVTATAPATSAPAPVPASATQSPPAPKQ